MKNSKSNTQSGQGLVGFIMILFILVIVILILSPVLADLFSVILTPASVLGGL
jgi:hypothetical protein